MTLADGDTYSIPTDDAKMAIQGDLATPGGKNCAYYVCAATESATNQITQVMDSESRTESVLPLAMFTWGFPGQGLKNQLCLRFVAKILIIEIFKMKPKIWFC